MCMTALCFHNDISRVVTPHSVVLLQLIVVVYRHEFNVMNFDLILFAEFPREVAVHLAKATI